MESGGVYVYLFVQQTPDPFSVTYRRRRLPENFPQSTIAPPLRYEYLQPQVGVRHLEMRYWKKLWGFPLFSEDLHASDFERPVLTLMAMSTKPIE